MDGKVEDVVEIEPAMHEDPFEGGEEDCDACAI